MNDESLKKFNRIIAILTQLQSKRIVKAKDLAERFDVSLRTIYRDIRTLETTGVPIVSESGVGYSIMSGYRLPPVMFTREEAGSFITAEKLMQKFTDKNMGDHYASAMFKIKSVLRLSDKDWVDMLENQISVYPSRQLFNNNIPNALEVILDSIADKKQVVLKYKSPEGDFTERLIEPVAVFHEFNFWYVLGYCLLRNDYRQFRTDRMLSVQRTANTTTQKHQQLEEYRATFALGTKIKVRLNVERKMAKYILNSKIHYGFVSEIEKGDHIEMTFMTSEIKEGFPRWFIMFADGAEIVEPPQLIDNVNALLENIQHRMQIQKEAN